MKILVVDDNEDSRILVQTILEAQGHEIDCADDGFEALKLAGRWQPGLIISDIMMPKMDGFELCRKLKEDPELKYIPVVLFSVTYTDVDSSQLAKEVGASRFILKTLEPAQFVKEINEVIQEYSATGLEVPTKPVLADEQLDMLHYRSVVNKLSEKVEELNQTNKALRKSEESYRTMVEGSSDAIITMDNQMKISSWNPGAEAMFGYQASEALGRHVSFLVPERLAREPEMVMAQVRAQGFLRGHETVRLTKSGREVEVEISLGLMKSETGRAIGMSAIVRDITERKRTEKILREKSEELSARVKELSCLYSISKLLEEHEIPLAEVFQQCLAIIPGGLRDPENSWLKIVYQDREFLPGNFQDTSCKLFVELVVLGNKVGELAVYKAAGENNHGSCDFCSDEKKLLEAIAGRLQALIERVEAEQEKEVIEKQLIQAQKMEAIGTLAGGIAHDFNNILTPILGYATIVLENLPEGSQDRQDLQQVITAGQRATDLVKQILSFSRRSEQEKQPVQIQFIIKEALKLLRASIPVNIDFEQAIDTKCGLVWTDPSKIHQVVMNLCTNAYHAMRDQGGVLSVSLREEAITQEEHPLEMNIEPGNYVVLEVSDTGHGMSQELQERIFEPYFTTKKQGEGTGLGLSVVHGLVYDMGGRITVSSELEKGTTFRVYFPRYELEAVATEETEGLVVAGGNERVLVVDDEEAIVNLNKKILQRLGYRVTALSSSSEALAVFTRAPQDFDLVITDMAMPGLDGVALAAKLLEVRPDIPLILCTGFSEKLDREKAKDFGFAEYLFKPVDRASFAVAIRKVLGKGG